MIRVQDVDTEAKVKELSSLLEAAFAKLAEITSFPTVRGGSASRNPAGQLVATGKCWHCGKALKNSKAFFCLGHDRAAEGYVVIEEFGGVAEMMDRLGYGPKGPKKTKP